jgi:hypothetical protein
MNVSILFSGEEAVTIRNRIFIGLVLAIMALVVVACGSNAAPAATEAPAAATEVATEAATEAPTEVATEAADTGTTDFRITNNSSVEICYVQVSDVGNDTWGEDWLGKDTTIPAGSEFLVKGLANGDYDIRALDCDQKEIATNMAVTFDGGEVTWTFSN